MNDNLKATGGEKAWKRHEDEKKESDGWTTEDYCQMRWKYLVDERETYTYMNITESGNVRESIRAHKIATTSSTCYRTTCLCSSVRPFLVKKTLQHYSSTIWLLSKFKRVYFMRRSSQYRIQWIEWRLCKIMLFSKWEPSLIQIGVKAYFWWRGTTNFLGTGISWLLIPRLENCYLCFVINSFHCVYGKKFPLFTLLLLYLVTAISRRE